MKIYDDYINTIRKAMTSGRSSDVRGFSASIGESAKNLFTYKDFVKNVSESKLLPSLNDFAQEMGLTPNFDQQLGLHPDFSHLKQTGQVENHYIISVFIDIKGSTNLFRKYDPETILIINNTIQRAAIHTCLIFGGYVHRLQGDGLFVYFGGKRIDRKSAVVNAISACSVFSYFVKVDLKNLFNEQGIETVYTRIGIDLGLDNDVLWSKAGIGEISEVTTCSLHTSLASKMQAFAQSNGIVVGDNIKNEVTAETANFFQVVSQRTKDENDRYIFRIPDKSFYYTQYDFDWQRYLKSQKYIATDLDGNLVFIQIPKNNTLPNSLANIARQSTPYS